MTTSSVWTNDSTSSENNESNESPSLLGLCSVVIGLVGSVTNSLELIQICHKQKKVKTGGVHLLSINQNLLDVIACLFLFLSYTMKQTKLVLSGSLGDWLCTLFYSDTVIWVGLTGSVANEVIVAFLLYFEAKHFNLYKKLFRRWLIYFFVALTWADGVAINNPFALSNYVKDGVCYSTGLWTTTAEHVAFGAWAFAWEYLLPITLTAYWYGSITFEARREAMTISPTTQVSSHSESGGQRTHLSGNILLLYKTNSVKAKIAHLVLHAVFWFSCHICLLILSWRSRDIKLDDTYSVSLFFGCLQISVFQPLVNSIDDGCLIKRMQAVVARCYTGSPFPDGRENGERSEVDGTNSQGTASLQ